MNKLLFAAVFSAVLSLPATDPFNDPGIVGCDLGSVVCPNWTVASGGASAWQIPAGGHEVAPAGVSTDDVVFWNLDSFTADQYSQVTVTIGASNGYVGPGVRLTAGANGYAFGCGTHTLYKFVAGSRSDLDSSHAACSDNDVVKLEVTGTSTTSLVIKINGVQDGSTYNDSSSPFTSGSAGMWGYPSTPENVQTWTGDNLGGPPPSTFPPGIINNPIRCCRFQVFGR